MDLTRRQFGKAAVGALAALTLPPGFKLVKQEEEIPESFTINEQIYVAAVLDTETMAMGREALMKRIINPMLLALSNHIKHKKITKLGKASISKVYDPMNDQEVLRIDVYGTSDLGGIPAHKLNYLPKLEWDKIANRKLGEKIVFGG